MRPRLLATPLTRSSAYSSLVRSAPISASDAPAFSLVSIFFLQGIPGIDGNLEPADQVLGPVVDGTVEPVPGVFGVDAQPFGDFEDIGQFWQNGIQVFPCLAYLGFQFVQFFGRGFGAQIPQGVDFTGPESEGSFIDIELGDEVVRGAFRRVWTSGSSSSSSGTSLSSLGSDLVDQDKIALGADPEQLNSSSSAFMPADADISEGVEFRGQGGQEFLGFNQVGRFLFDHGDRIGRCSILLGQQGAGEQNGSRRAGT